MINPLTFFLNISSPLIDNAAVMIETHKKRRIFPLGAEHHPHFKVGNQQYSDKFNRPRFTLLLIKDSGCKIRFEARSWNAGQTLKKGVLFLI